MLSNVLAGRRTSSVQPAYKLQTAGSGHQHKTPGLDSSTCEALDIQILRICGVCKHGPGKTCNGGSSEQKEENSIYPIGDLGHICSRDYHPCRKHIQEFCLNPEYYKNCGENSQVSRVITNLQIHAISKE